MAKKNTEHLKTLTFENDHQEISFVFDDTKDFISVFELQKSKKTIIGIPATLSKEWTKDFLEKSLLLLKEDGVCEFKTPLNNVLILKRENLIEIQKILNKE